MKRYFSSLLLGLLAVLLTLAGILSVTVWKPAQDVTATGTTEAPFLVTRPGLLGLYGDGETVHIVAKTPNADDDIWIAFGSPTDVAGWVSTHPHAEIYGLSDLTTLKMESYLPGGEQPQSGEESAEQGQPQSGEEPVNPIASDMWELERHGNGSLELVVSKDQMDSMLIAATNGVDAAPSLTFSWDTPRQNLASLFLFSFAVLFALLAAFTAFITWRRVRRRKLIRTRLQAQINADSTETTMIPAIAGPNEEAVVEEDKVTESVEAAEPVESTPDAEFAPEAGEGGPTEDIVVVAEDEVGEVPKEDLKGEDFLDRSQQLTTDSGLINLTALHGGAKFPTRRALREAQARGVDTLVIEGQEFSTTTGSIPRVEEESEQLSATTELLGRRSLRDAKLPESDGEARDDA